MVAVNSWWSLGRWEKGLRGGGGGVVRAPLPPPPLLVGDAKRYVSVCAVRYVFQRTPGARPSRLLLAAAPTRQEPPAAPREPRHQSSPALPCPAPPCPLLRGLLCPVLSCPNPSTGRRLVDGTPQLTAKDLDLMGMTVYDVKRLAAYAAHSVEIQVRPNAQRRPPEMHNACGTRFLNHDPRHLINHAGPPKHLSAQGGGEWRSAIVRNFSQFSAIFPQVPSACPPCVRVGALCICEQLLQNNLLQCFPAPPQKKRDLGFNFMVILVAACRRNSDTRGRFDLFQHSQAPVQHCCSLRLREVQFGLVTMPQFSRSFPQVFRNISPLGWTLPDRNPPPPPLCISDLRSSGGL